ncbi:MAG: hypothetical protein ABWY64_14525 [Tardiphaga sp.]
MEALTGRRLRPLTVLPTEWPKAEPAADDAAHTLTLLLESIRRYRRLILGIVLAGIVLAAVGSSLMSRSYMATAQLALNARGAAAADGGGSAGAVATVGAGSEDTAIDTHVTLLLSDGYLRRLLPALRALEATHHDTAAPRAGALLREAWSNLKKRLSVTSEQPTEGSALSALKARLKVSQERRSRIISVIFNDVDPKRAADVANLVARSYIDELDRQRQAVQSQALNAIATQSSVVQGELEQARTELEASRLGQVTPSQSATLEWKITTLAQQLEGLLRRRQDLTTKGSASDPEVSLIAYATPPETPNSLNPLLLVPPVTIAFAILACLLAIILHRLDRTLHTEAEAAEALGIPCAGSIPSISLELRTRPPRMPSPRTISDTRAIRSAIVSILIANPQGSNSQQAVLVTSSVRGEGKTAISWSFAFCGGQLGRRVLLLDFGVKSALPGGDAADLAGVLADGRPLLDAIRPVPQLSVDYLSGGVSDLDCLSVLAHPKMPLLFEQLKELYDLIVIDAPALQDAPEVRLLARWADHVLLVIRAGSTHRDVAKAMLHQLTRIEDLIGNTQFWSLLTRKYPAIAPTDSEAPIRSSGFARSWRMRAAQKRIT